MSDRTAWQRIRSCGVCGGVALSHFMARYVDGSSLDRCLGCDVVLLNPRPGPEEVAAWYKEAYFTGSSTVTMGTNHLAMTEAALRHGTEPFRQLARRVPLRRQRLLEVGCGMGAFLLQCRDAGAEVTGLDVSHFAARRLATSYGVHCLIGSVESLSPPKQPFDIVAFVDVVEHVLSPRSFLRALHTFLSQSGVVYGVLPNLDSIRHYGAHWAGLARHPEHLYYFGATSLRNLLTLSGFELIGLWTYGEPSGDPTPAHAPHRSPLIRLTDALRRVRPLASAVRGGRAALRRLSQVERQRQARYRQGLGHDLYFLARKPRT